MLHLGPAPVGVEVGMMEDAATGDARGAQDLEPTDPPRRTPTWAIVVRLASLAVVVLFGGWVVAAKTGLNRYEEASGGTPDGACDGDLTSKDVRPPFVAPEGLPDEVAEVARAFESFFAQDRWSYRDVSEDLTGADPDHEIRFAADGDLLERSEPDGFQGLIRPGAGIARYDENRFWVPACVNGFLFQPVFRTPQCVESDTRGETLHVRWVSQREGTCEDATSWFGATIQGEKLIEWTTELRGRVRQTATVVAPRSLSWPSPVWIVPSWLTSDSDD